MPGPDMMDLRSEGNSTYIKYVRDTRLANGVLTELLYTGFGLHLIFLPFVPLLEQF